MGVIIVGILSLVGSLVATFAGIMTSNKLTIYRIQKLEEKVNQHNKVIDRTYNLEKKEALVEQEQNEIKNDISDIKTDIKGLKEKNA